MGKVGNNNGINEQYYGNPLAQPVLKGVDEPYAIPQAAPHVQSMKPKKQASNAWRDLPFAIAFGVMVLIIIALAGIYGKNALNGSSGSNSSSSSDYLSKKETYSVLSMGLGACVVAAILSMVVVRFMVKYAQVMITFALWFQIGLSLITAVIAFAAGAIFLGVISLIFTAIGVCYARLVRHRIPFASANLKVAAEAIKSHCSTHGIAVLFLVVQIIWIVIWSIAFLGVYDKTNSNNHKTSSSRGRDNLGASCYYNSDCSSGYCSSGYCRQKPSSSMSFVAYFFLALGLYWGLAVFRNITHCTVIGTVATWWYSTESKGATLSSLKRSCTTSFGSICFGSLLVAIIQALRAVAENGREQGSILGCIFECILGCLQSLMEYFNRWAYVYVGVYGYKYLEAGKAVLNVFRSRGFDAIINDDLIQNVLLLAAVTVGLLCAAICVGVYYMHKSILQSSGAPAVIGVLGFMIGTGIATIPLSVIDSSVCTVFVCFAEDPSAFAAAHPQLYSNLVTEWQRVYPDVIASNGYTYSSAV